MPCDPIVDRNGLLVGFVCSPSMFEPIQLARGIWMIWDDYFGPTFYTRKDMEKEIDDWYEKPRIVKLFDEWLANYKKEKK